MRSLCLIVVLVLCLPAAVTATQVKLTNGTYGYLLFWNEALQQWRIVHSQSWNPTVHSRLACLAAHLSAKFALSAKGPNYAGMPSATEYLAVTYDLDCTDASTDLFGCPASSITPDVSSSSLVYVECPNDCPQSPALDGHTCRICSKPHPWTRPLTAGWSAASTSPVRHLRPARMPSSTMLRCARAATCPRCSRPRTVEPPSTSAACATATTTVGRRGYFECRPRSVLCVERCARRVHGGIEEPRDRQHTLLCQPAPSRSRGASAYARRQLVEIATS